MLQETNDSNPVTDGSEKGSCEPPAKHDVDSKKEGSAFKSYLVSLHTCLFFPTGMAVVVFLANKTCNHRQ